MCHLFLALLLTGGDLPYDFNLKVGVFTMVTVPAVVLFVATVREYRIAAKAPASAPIGVADGDGGVERLHDLDVSVGDDRYVPLLAAHAAGAGPPHEA